MRTYALISQKGGAGKSTLACHLAALAGEAGPALMIDRDPQATSGKWWERRTKLTPAPEWPELLDLEGKALAAAVAGFRSQAGALFVDTRPAVQEPEAEAARAADLVIVPVRPTMNDLEAVGDTLDMVKRIARAAGRHDTAVIVVNAARNEGRARDAKAALSRYGVPVCPDFLTDRTVYHDAAIEGRTVMEMRGPAADAAAAEMRKVWTWIEGTQK